MVHLAGTSSAMPGADDFLWYSFDAGDNRVEFDPDSILQDWDSTSGMARSRMNLYTCFEVSSFTYYTEMSSSSSELGLAWLAR